jgi:hypothetical protein
VNLETAQEGQTDAGGPWDYKRSSEWGGHAVLGGRYSDSSNGKQDRTGVVTWVELIDMTDGFISRQLEEVWVVIWPEHLTDKTFLEGVDLATLAADYEALTGRDFPAPVTPAPQPTLDPNTDDLAGCLGTIISAAQRALDIVKGKTS